MMGIKLAYQLLDSIMNEDRDFNKMLLNRFEGDHKRKRILKFLFHLKFSIEIQKK